jgi:hypothetical protein
MVLHRPNFYVYFNLYIPRQQARRKKTRYTFYEHGVKLSLTSYGIYV